MNNLKENEILKVIISASEMNINENGEIIPFPDNFEYRIDISFYSQSQKESIIDISYSISGDAANNISLEEELETNIKIQMDELGIKKYSILETEVDIAEGYGRQLIKIDTIKG